MAIDIEIQTEQQGNQVFGPNDSISGLIIVTLSKDTSLRNIEVKLKAIETTTVQYWTLRNNRRERRTCSSQHQWYHKTWRVFPSSEISAETSGKYTLPKGVHEYEFNVQFPNDPQIPGSLSSMNQGFQIQHFIKVSVHRDSHWKVDKRLQVARMYFPSVPTHVLDDPTRSNHGERGELVRKYENPKEGISKVFSRSPRSTASVEVTLNAPAHGLPQAPRPLCLRLHVSTNLEVSVTHVTVALSSFTGYFAVDPYGGRQGSSESVLHPILSKDLNLTGTEFELTDFVYHAMIKGILCPTFSSVYINRTYHLEVTVTVADPKNLTRTRDIKVMVKKVVLPPIEIRTAPSRPLMAMNPEPIPLQSLPAEPMAASPLAASPVTRPEKQGEKQGELPDFKSSEAPPAYNG